MERQKACSFDLVTCYNLYRFTMLRFIHVKGISQEADAEDVLQEAFLRAYERLETFQARNGSSLLTWIQAIALNVIRDQARLRNRKSQVPQSLCIDGVDVEQIPQESDQQIAPILLEEVLGLCNDAERELFLAMGDHGGVLAAARALGLNPDTAKVRVFRARKKIQEVCSR